MKRLGALLLAGVILLCFSVGFAEEQQTFTPGTYEIETMGHNGAMKVSVTFDEHAITDIQLGENNESGYIGEKAFDAMAGEILERQSLNVDTLSGATVTGAVVRAAVRSAVEQAGGDPAAMNAPAEPDETKYEDIKHQVVVVGSGIAGLTSTVQAQELGLDVLLIEQLGLLGGSSVRAAYMVGGDTILQQQQGISFTSEDWMHYMCDPMPRAGSDPGLAQLESATSMALAAGDNINWLYDLGVEFGDVSLNWQHYGPNGNRIGPYAVTALQKVIEDRGIEYRLNTRADEILMEDGRAIGVRVEAPNGQFYNIYADAVILATGGYFGNQAMTDKYDPIHAANYSDECKGSDGSGMLMAEAIGAELKYMDQANYHGLATYWNGASRALTLPAGNGCIAVNKDGKRYADEAGSYELLTQGTMAQDEAFCIMDQTMMDLEVIKADKGLSNIVEMYVKADTLEELAEALGINVENFVETVNNYTEYVHNGEDPDFGKNPLFMRSDFTTAPYYGVKSMVENHTNHGGISVDIENHALTPEGEIIPGLFAAGECAASHIQGFYTYQASVHNGRVSARVIAEELAAQ